jgi:hypothetical protein
MRTGTYNANGQPVITGHIYHLPNTDLLSAQFLVDSGADMTVLSGSDAIQSGFASAATTDGDDDMRFPPDSNVETVTAQGVGGESTMYIIRNPVEIGFIDRDASGEDHSVLHLEGLAALQIAPDTTHSLLGRDVINRFDVTFSYVDQQVEFERRDIETDAGRDLSVDR